MWPAKSPQEVESCRQSLQEAIYNAQQPRQEARDHGQCRQPTLSMISCFLLRLLGRAEAIYDGQSQQEVKTGRLVYILCKITNLYTV